MNHREVTSIASGMEGRGRLGDVLANDRHVADVAVAEPELVVGKADGSRVVRPFRLSQRLGQKRDPAGGFTACHREPAVHPPQIRKTRRIEPLSSFGRLPKRLRCTTHIVLKEPRFGKGAPDLDLLVAVQAWLPHRADEDRGRLDPGASFERARRLAVEIRRWHGA